MMHMHGSLNYHERSGTFSVMMRLYQYYSFKYVHVLKTHHRWKPLDISICYTPFRS